MLGLGKLFAGLSRRQPEVVRCGMIQGAWPCAVCGQMVERHGCADVPEHGERCREGPRRGFGVGRFRLEPSLIRCGEIMNVVPCPICELPVQQRYCSQPIACSVPCEIEASRRRIGQIY